jgi:glucosylceramidase
MYLKNYRLVFCVFLLLIYFGYGQKAKEFNVSGKKVSVFTTAKGTDLKLSPTDTLQFAEDNNPFLEKNVYVFVDTKHSFQSIVGIGGALTDAAAEVFAKMPANKQKEILEAYYSADKGIGYNVARTNIASCDFSSSSYNYVKDNDPELKSFSLAHDEEFKIPLIKKAIEATNDKLTLFASPWSPPAWMKDTNDVLKGGKLLPKYYQSWANYFVKFIKGYEAKGIKIWGITVQNEPMGPQTWESCIFLPSEERDFIKNNLGPTMHKNGFANKKIIAWDQNRDMIYQQASTILNDPEAAKYIWGIGVHWYEAYAYRDSRMQFENMKRVQESFPNMNLFNTEACNLNYKADQVNDWSLGERYGRSMINDFNSGSVAWTDWNIILDEKGGPNHVGNFLFAPIHANTKTGELVYTNSFYYIGQFSKFVKPGAKRIAVSTSREDFIATGFVNPDGKLVVIVMNDKDVAAPFNLAFGNQIAKGTCLPHSISTLVIE